MNGPTIALRHLARCLDGQRIPLNSEQRSGMAGQYPYWGAGSVVDHVDRYLFDEELILLGEDGAPFFDDARSVAFRVAEPVWVNNHIHVLRPAPTVDARFLAYCLNVVDYRLYIGGSTRDKLTQDDMREIVLPARSPADQRRIADFLDDQVARIDNLIAARRAQVRALAQSQRRSIDDAMGYGPQPTVRLGLLASLQGGLTIDAKRRPENAVEFEYLRVANVQAGRLDLQEVKTVGVSAEVAGQYLLRAGDVLMTEGGDIDKLGRGTVWRADREPMLHQNHVFAVRPHQRVLTSDYLAYSTATSFARAYFESTGIQTTNLASISSSKVMALRVVPRTVSEQDEVVDRIRQSEDSINGLVLRLESSAERFQEMKRSLITAAVTGDFDVSTADGSQVLA